MSGGVGTGVVADKIPAITVRRRLIRKIENEARKKLWKWESWEKAQKVSKGEKNTQDEENNFKKATTFPTKFSLL